MNKVVCTLALLASFAGVSCAVRNSDGQELVLARRGESADCRIVVPETAGESRLFAATELRDYVERMTGVRLEIERGTTPPKGIFLDEPDDPSLGTDGFRLVVQGSSLRVKGGCRGVLYGVYELLERFGGCGWYASWRTVVPRAERFAVPADLDERQVPSFRFRMPSWKDVQEHPEFAAKLRFNGGSAEEKRFGGPAFRFVRRLGKCHTFDYLMRPGKWFKEHPEYFSEVDGVRKGSGTQLCLTNPDVLRIVTSNVLATIESDPLVGKGDWTDIVGVSQNDNAKTFCTCARCRAVDEAEDSHAGTMVPFINAIAEAVERKYPRMLVETLVYQYSRKFPKTARYRPNVIPCVCSVECSWSRPLAERQEENNGKFMDDLESWGRTTDKMFVWDYTTDYYHFSYPMPCVRVLQPNMKTFLAHGVNFIYEEGGPWHADFAELKAWMIGKLAWDVNQPVDALLDRFFTGYYGAAAPLMRKYFDRVESILGDDPKSVLTCWDEDRPEVFTDEFLRWARGVFNEALKAVADDPECRQNVRFQMGCLRMLWLDRHGSKVKGFWLTRSPEGFAAPDADLREDAREMLDLLGLSRRIGQPISLNGGYCTNIWNRITNYSRPARSDSKCRIGASQMWCKGNIVKRIKDGSAKDGVVFKFGPASWTWMAYCDLGMVALDSDVDYRVRFRARIERQKGGTGEAFRAVLGDQVVAPTVGECPKGWHWYSFKPMRLTDDSKFRIKGGLPENGGGRKAVKYIVLDQIEITPIGRGKCE